MITVTRDREVLEAVPTTGAYRPTSCRMTIELCARMRLPPCIRILERYWMVGLSTGAWAQVLAQMPAVE